MRSMADNGSRKNKVLLGITKSNFGGAQRYVYDLARTLKERGFEVSVLCGGSGLLVEKLTSAGIRTITLPALERDVRIQSDIRTFFSLLRILRSERPDIFHLNSSKMGAMGALAARIIRVRRIVFTVHGWAFNEPRSSIARAIIYMIACLTVLLAHRTIAVSRAVANDVPQWLRGRVRVIENGIGPISFFDRMTARYALMRKDRTLTEGLWIGSVAELHPVKGIDFGIAGCERLLQKRPDAHYIVLGDGEMRGELEREIASKGLAGRVHLLGFVEDASSYLLAFDIFLMPSLSEALSLALLEAGAAGLPVIASNVGGIPEIIEHQETGILVASHSAEEIANALKVLAGDPDKQRTLGETLRSHVQRNFQLARMVEETEQLYLHQ